MKTTTTTTKIAMTAHAVHDRSDRFVFIAEHIGWGTVLYKMPDPARNSVLSLTSTGVILVKSWDETKLVTAYIASISQASAICRSIGMSCVPKNMANVIYHNSIIKRRFGIV